MALTSGAKASKATSRRPLFSLYEEMERRFEERGSYVSPDTLEKCYALLLAMLRKKRPMKPSEIADILLFDPAYRGLSDVKRTVFYELEHLKEIGMIKTAAGRYELVGGFIPRLETAKPRELAQITDPRVKPLLASWNRIRRLRGIVGQWGISSLAHSIVYELSLLLRYNDMLAGESNREGRRRLEAIEDRITRLMEVYVAYARTGQLPRGEDRLFYDCEEKLLKFCKRIWWDYGSAYSSKPTL
jgi:hypothetical protein